MVKLFLTLLWVSFLTAQAIAAPPQSTTLSISQLEQLAAPIALYPDPLLGLILPASVFPDQIIDAALLIKNKSDAELISQQSWDSSVKGIATYPGVLKMMYERIDWTAKLGDAFLNQSSDLRKVIQSLRQKAQNVGNLQSTKEQQVSTAQVNGETVIRIEPTTPQTVYVPQYSTQTVYTQPAPASSNYLVPLATFGLGMALGSALADDDDDVYVYGGYPGRVVWYNDNSVEHWADNRQDMIRDSQNHRQDMSKDRTNFNQDMREDRQTFRQDQVESGNYQDKASRDQFKQQQTAKRQQYSGSAQQNRENYRSSVNSSQQSQQYQQRKQQAQQRTQEWKSSASDRGWATSSATTRQNTRTSAASGYSGSRSSAYQGYSSRSSASAYSSRGASSRSAGGYSRGARGAGGGRSMSRGGGGRRR